MLRCVVGQDEPMPEAMIEAHHADAFAVVTTWWCYGDLEELATARDV